MQDKRLYWKIYIIFLIAFSPFYVSCADKELGKDWFVHKGPSVVFIGDSITWQWDKEGFNPEYFNSHGYVNMGVSGDKTTNMLARFKSDVLDLDPHCVVLSGGANDLTSSTDLEIIERLEEMVDKALAANIMVVLGSLLPSNDYQIKDFRPELRIAPLNDKIKDLAKSKGALYADYYSVMVDEEQGLKKEYQKYDAVHPNRQGYIAMAGVIEPILNCVLSIYYNRP